MMKGLKIILLLLVVSPMFAHADKTQHEELQSVLQEKNEKVHKLEKNPFGIAFLKPNYVLPYYYTDSPYQAIYDSRTPDNQAINPNEFKFQLSFQVPILKNLFGTHTDLKAGYTQLSYWQVYSKSAFFRETNYEPELFLTHQYSPNWNFILGVVHQSNGRGGDLERSWNRSYFEGQYSIGPWLFSIKPWVLIFKSQSSDLHNENITDFLGHARFLAVYKNNYFEVSLMLRNLIESGFSRGAEELTISFPLFGHLKGFIQGFSGYGQSLIEYDHYTNSFGIGLSLSNWI